MSSKVPTSVRTSIASFRETLWIALDTLRAHKLRSFLTLLGVILAVTTLVAVMSVLDGLNLYVSDKIANLGANAFVVDRLGIITNFDEWTKAQRRPPLTLEDFEALRDRMQLAQRVGAVEQNNADVRYGNTRIQDVELLGVTPNFIDIRNFDVELGRFLTEGDELHRAPICFIGADLVKKFFPNLDPIGKTIRVGMEQYAVVGVAKARGTVLGQSQDNFVMLPLGTYRESWHGANDSVIIFVQARGPEWMSAAEDEVRAVIRARRHVPYDDPDNFGLIAPTSITGVWQQLTGNVFAITVWLTSIFLVVGGIVIMNIMLASVTERTREIGLRKSLGAQRRHIVAQFLMESSVLAVLGGLVGVVAALAIGGLVRATTPIPVSTPLRAVVIALALSSSVGLFFGIYPAVRAARLEPIEALRAEA